MKSKKSGIIKNCLKKCVPAVALVGSIIGLTCGCGDNNTEVTPSESKNGGKIFASGISQNNPSGDMALFQQYIAYFEQVAQSLPALNEYSTAEAVERFFRVQLDVCARTGAFIESLDLSSGSPAFRKEMTARKFMYQQRTDILKNLVGAMARQDQQAVNKIGESLAVVNDDMNLNRALLCSIVYGEYDKQKIRQAQINVVKYIKDSYPSLAGGIESLPGRNVLEKIRNLPPYADKLYVFRSQITQNESLFECSQEFIRTVQEYCNCIYISANMIRNMPYIPRSAEEILLIGLSNISNPQAVDKYTRDLQDFTNKVKEQTDRQQKIYQKLENIAQKY